MHRPQDFGWKAWRGKRLA